MHKTCIVHCPFWENCLLPILHLPVKTLTTARDITYIPIFLYLVFGRNPLQIKIANVLK